MKTTLTTVRQTRRSASLDLLRQLVTHIGLLTTAPLADFDGLVQPHCIMQVGTNSQFCHTNRLTAHRARQSLTSKFLQPRNSQELLKKEKGGSNSHVSSDRAISGLILRASTLRDSRCFERPKMELDEQSTRLLDSNDHDKFDFTDIEQNLHNNPSSKGISTARRG